MLVTVAQLGSNPTPDECPNFLYMFNDYVVCTQTLAVRCSKLLNAFLKAHQFRNWQQGAWFVSVLSKSVTKAEILQQNDAWCTHGDIAEIFANCKELIDSLSSPEETLEKFLIDVLKCGKPSLTLKFRQKTKIEFESLDVYLNSPASETSKWEILARTTWAVFWRSYQFLQWHSRMTASTATMVQSFRHIPSLVSSVIQKPITTPIKHLTSIVTKRKSSLLNSEPMELNTEYIPYAMWMCNQLENINYQRRVSHTVLRCSSKMYNERERRIRKISDIGLAHLLKYIHHGDLLNIVNVYFETVMEGNLFVQQYVLGNYVNLPFVTEIRGMNIHINNKVTEYCCEMYDRHYSEYVQLKLNCEEKLKNVSLEENNVLHLQASFSNTRTEMFSDIQRCQAMRSKLLEAQSNFLSIKLVLFLCNAWSQGYAEGYRILPAHELKDYTRKMRDKICKILKPLENLVRRILDQLEASESITLPVTLALTILSHVDTEVKDILGKAVSIVVSRSEIKQRVLDISSRKKNLAASSVRRQMFGL